MEVSAHNQAPTGRYGFVVWNEFQAIHFSGLLNRCQKPIVFLIVDRSAADFVRYAPLIESKYAATVIKVKEAELSKYDGILDGLFAQTNFKGIEKFKRTPLFAVQYSLTKESHQYGAWHMDFSAAFCYGGYSARQMEYACTTFACGHPRLNASDVQVHLDLVELYKKEIDPEKPTLLYAPTWGIGGLVEEFLVEMDWLRQRYNVIIRPHHNTMSRELSRIGLISLPERQPFTDDFATQCSVADLVISDYSGAIFDAMYLNKPVLLFRDESVAELRRSSFSTDSIEVARSSDIGPIAATGEQLREILSDTEFSFRKAFAERNERLLEECFVAANDPSRKILEIADAWRSEPVDLPRQRWLRNHVKKKLRAATGNPSQGKSKPTRKKAQAATRPKSLRQRLRARYRSLIALLLSRREVLVPYLRLRSKVSSDSYARQAAKVLINIGEYRQAANVLAPRVRKSDRIDDSFFRLWIREPGNRIGVDRARDFCSSFDCSRLAPAAELRKAVCTSDSEGIRRIESKALSATAHTDNENIQSGLSALMVLRRYEEVEAIVSGRPALLKLATVQRMLKRIEAARQDLGNLKEYAVQASSGKLQAPMGASEIRICLPPHFFGSNSQKMLNMRARNWEAVRSVYRELISAVEKSSDLSVRVGHQYFLNFIEEQNQDPTISFFTKGGGLGNWHLKDVGLGNLVSLDPDGYLSSSMLAKIPGQELLASLAEKAVDESIFERCAELFRLHGGDKYRRLDVAPVGIGLNDYIFVALQSTKGLEETFQPVESLIRTLVSYSRKTGRNVVFKRHPLCEDMLITRALAEADTIPTVYVSNIDTWKLVEDSSVVVTVNSGVALQAIAAAKPLIISGPSEMAVVATYARKFDDIPSVLESLKIEGSLRDQYAKYLTFYIDHYLVDPSRHDELLERLRAIIAITRSADEPEAVRREYFEYLVRRY